MKKPYSFPLRSRADIADFLTRRGRSYHYQRYTFVWNVKTHGARFDGDSLRKHFPDLSMIEDSAWDDLLNKDTGDLFWSWCEDAGRNSGVEQNEWTSYPGDDQGDWEFSFAGRSGGWLVLDKWRGRDMRDVDSADFLDPEIWSFDDLRSFYRGIVCADQDFTPQKAAAEVEFMAAFYREQWEDDRAEARESEAQAVACEIMAARPDLAPTWEGVTA
jgi:hypothetical protein